MTEIERAQLKRIIERNGLFGLLADIVRFCQIESERLSDKQEEELSRSYVKVGDAVQKASDIAERDNI